jgi:acylphosphatase
MNTTAVRWIIRGDVQGVGFRHFARQSAVQLGLRGTVRNLADGTVEVFVAGPEADVAVLRARLSEGPRWADVTGIESTEADVDRLPAGFEVRL